MNLFPRRALKVTPLSPGVESLLRSLPRATAPGDTRMRLLAAYARTEGGRVSLRLGLGWVRLAIPASAAAVAVLGVGLAMSGRGGAPSKTIEMVSHGGLQAPATIAMRVVDDPQMPMMPSSVGGMPAFAMNADAPDGP